MVRRKTSTAKQKSTSNYRRSAQSKIRDGGLGRTFREYLDDKIKLERWQIVGIMMLIFVIAGVIGWVYEFLFARIDLGEWYMQGGNLLPWINIYAFGALILVPVVYKIRRYPWAVFVTSFFVTGAVELIGGWLVYTVGNGTRYWDYNDKPWNFGNIGGFVCLLSVTIFAIFAMILTYVILPWCIHLARRMSKRAFLTLASSLFAVIMLDEVTNLVLKNCGLPNAMDLYRSLGWEYAP